jgi:alpha-N-arabinofuranosidase
VNRIHLLSVVLLLAAASGARPEQPPAGPETSIDVQIDATNTGPPINRFIYGQFIEHLGRCIYGGIWAEMLEDRKFFFPIRDKYRPYREPVDTGFPVIDGSPWQVVGPAGSVTMSRKEPFVGEHTPRVAAGSGIRQNDLGLVANKKYVGYLWLRAPDGAAKLTVSLSWGDGRSAQQLVTVKPQGADFARYPLKFTSAGESGQGRFTIEVAGAPCFIGAASLMPADNVRGFRADTLALLKQLNATMYRWPGGNFVSGYDWRDGLGPRDRRPPRRNPAWSGIEHNDVGIDEFIDFCREVGAEPMITVNTGFGDDYSAAQEVEYANGSTDTIGGSWRVRNGHAEPYRVTYWCVGNEMFGNWQLGYMQLAHYTQKHNRVAQAMRKVAPGLVLIGSGDLGTKTTVDAGGARRELSWTQGMLERCSQQMDLISEHFYCGLVPWSQETEIPTLRHAGLVREEIRKKANGHRELQKIERGPTEGFIPIAMDEWNYWHRKHPYGELGCQYSLVDALGVAAGLHEFFRNTDIIHMAHYAQTVNVLGCIKTTKTSAFFDTTALPLLLYRREFGTLPLAVKSGDTSGAVDVAAAKTEDGRALTIGIVNPHAAPQSVRLAIRGAKPHSTATLWRITGESPAAQNAPGRQGVTIAEQKDAPFGDAVTVPPYSVNIYRVPAG